MIQEAVFFLFVLRILRGKILSLILIKIIFIPACRTVVFEKLVRKTYFT
jgi:hypothetical protein